MAYTTAMMVRNTCDVQEVADIFGETPSPKWYNGIIVNGLDTIISPNTNKQQLGLDISIIPTTQIDVGGITISNDQDTFPFIEDHPIGPTDNYKYSGKSSKVILNDTEIHGSEEIYLQCPSGDFKFKIKLLENTAAKVLIEIKPWGST